MLTVYPPSPDGPSQPHAGAVWIDLVGAGEAETQQVEAETGFDLPNREELSQIEPSSRLSFEDGVLRLAAPVIAKPDTDHPKLSHIGFILTPKLLVSVRYEPSKAFDAVARTVGPQCAKLVSAEVFAAVMEAQVAGQADLLEGARAHLDEISHRVFRDPVHNRRRIKRSNTVMREKLQALGRIGERTSIIRESLLGLDRAVAFALEAAKAWFSPEQTRRLKAVRDDLASLALFEEHLLGKVQFLLDAVLGFISIEQNDIFKVLTIASIVGIFPTLVAGWYGMNFQNMPELHWAYGYPFGIGMIVLSTIAPLLWFKWRGWL
ncbi:MAG TPA: magnesium transporter CorA family protein [Caulobacteraceae bacterium]